MNKSTLLTIAAGIALVAIGGPATAQASDSRTVSHRVSFADLNLATPQGVATLDNRISAAIRRVCGTGPMRSSDDLQNRRTCRREASASVTGQRRIAIAAAQRGNGAVQIAALAR